MQKSPLTAMGFETLQNKLYQLADQELQAQSRQITENFILWMDNNFELNTQQIRHLESMDKQLIQDLATQTAIAIQGRLKISLIKPEVKPINSYDSKYIKTTSKVRELASDDDHFEAEGELVIEIGY